jgi:hypothetical protein
MTTALGLVATTIALVAAFAAPAARAATTARSASVLSLAGQVIQDSLPANLTKNALVNVSDSEIFEEKSAIVLAHPLNVDITQPSSVPITHKTALPGQVAAGTAFTSWYVHTDPGPKSPPASYTHYTASVSFNTPILGIIVRAATLSQSDQLVGNPHTTYPGTGIPGHGNDQRGLELTGTAFGADSVEFANAYTLSWKVNTNVYLDDFRIITAADQSQTGVPIPLLSEGYRFVGSDGGVFAFHRGFYGSLGGVRLNAPIVSATGTPDSAGYLLVGQDGGVFAFGDANFYGSTGNVKLNKPIVALSMTASGGGYYLFAADGGVFAFGRAPFEGSLGSQVLNKPIVDGASDPLAAGYWQVASDGGVFAFNAPFYGSMGGTPLDAPVVAMASTADGGGYWEVASDGGVFSFGDARFYGSTGGIKLNQPVVSIISTPDGRGYWLVARDGGVFSFGDAQFYGSTGNVKLAMPIVDGF